LPAAGDLVVGGGGRAAAALRALPSRGSSLLWARLTARTPLAAGSLGALVHFIRVALQVGDAWAAQQLFVVLLERTSGLNRQWAARVVARTPGLRGSPATQVREDLHQELTLRLWDHIGQRDAEQWELFFRRALDFAQCHTATAHMEQRGYWTSPGVARPARVRSLPLSMLGRTGDDGEHMGGAPLLADSADHFSREDLADLADLRGLVLRLPEHERAVIVLCYWQQASEDEIASALRVTTRTVCNYQQRALRQLRAWYAGQEVTA
jgi:RNA polymerase sigma factor (sigma-70 family)